MTEYLDIDNWKRKEHFYFFKDYENPFFNICADVEITALYHFIKERKLSYFIASLYLSTKAANAIEAFRYRIKEDKVLIYPLIHAGSTVLNSDETFSFCYFQYSPDFQTFYQKAEKKLAQFKEGFKDLLPQIEHDNLIHYSVIPWISFRSFSHAKATRKGDSIPKIVLGKYFDEGDRCKKMPVSVEVHHSLMDGLHVAKFFETYQNYLKTPAQHLV